MQRPFLIFATAFVAMMAGALFYAAHLPVEHSQAAAQAQSAPAADLAAAEFQPVYPDFELPDLDGNVRRLTEWRGNHTLLNFWATWCAPCRREIPLLKSFHDEQGAEGIQVIGIAVDFTEQVLAYAEEAEFNYPVVIGHEEAMAVAESSGIDFIGMPFTMIVAADGELLNAHIGEIVEADLEHIDKVLAMLDSGEIDRDSARQALNFL